MRSTLPSMPVSVSTPVWKAVSTPSTLGGLLVLLGLASCGGSEAVDPFEPNTKPDQLYMQLVLNHRAINLSTAAFYNTFQLTATPLDGSGAPMTGLPAPTFRTSDPSKVKVSPDGLLTAGLTAGTGVSVIAELVAGNIRHADTAIVNVNATTDPPPDLATLSLEPASPDSAIVPILSPARDFTLFFWLSGSPFPVTPQSVATHLRALTSGGDPIPGLAVEYTSLDPTVVTVDRRTGVINPRHPGLARLVVRTAAYGVSKEATAEFTVTAPYRQTVIFSQESVGNMLFPLTPIIRQNGIIFWGHSPLNTGAQPADVVFDDPAAAVEPPAALCTLVQSHPFAPAPNACGTGNFVFPKGDWRIRQFPVPGTYTYRETQTGAVGQIVVVGDVSPSGSASSLLRAGRP